MSGKAGNGTITVKVKNRRTTIFIQTTPSATISDLQSDVERALLEMTSTATPASTNTTISTTAAQSKGKSPEGPQSNNLASSPHILTPTIKLFKTAVMNIGNDMEWVPVVEDDNDEPADGSNDPSDIQQPKKPSNNRRGKRKGDDTLANLDIVNGTVLAYVQVGADGNAERPVVEEPVDEDDAE